jgi:hypothetical protein
MNSLCRQEDIENLLLNHMSEDLSPSAYSET